MVTAGRHFLSGAATGTVSEAVIVHANGGNRMDIPGLIVPWLVHDVFSASQAAMTRFSTVIDNCPRLPKANMTCHYSC